jgi:5-methylcytosine-specific restriction protein A
MPQRPPSPCLQPGCPALVSGGTRCAEHTRRRERLRGSAHARGYGARWRTYRLTFLRAHPLCELCTAANRVEPATVVDHRVDHKGNMDLFWEPSNHRALCKRCHDARMDAGDFGR